MKNKPNWLLLIGVLLLPFASIAQVYEKTNNTYQIEEHIINMPYNPPSPKKDKFSSLPLSKMTITDNFIETDQQQVEYLNNGQGMKLHIFHPKVLPGHQAVEQPLPLIVFGYGCGFLSPWNNGAIGIPSRLAEQGYVVVAPEYRIGVNLLNEELAKRAVWRAVQDLRKTINYARTIQSSNYYVNTEKPVTYVGYSSGALMGLHNLYLNETNRPSATLNNYTLSTRRWYKVFSESRTSYDLGTLDNPFLGTGGSTTVSSITYPKNLGIQDITISIAGAIGDLNWIQNNTQVPQALYLIHHPQDGVVPFGQGYTFKNFVVFYPPVLALMTANGSGSIDSLFARLPQLKPAMYKFSKMDIDCPNGDASCLKGDAGGGRLNDFFKWYHSPAEDGNNTAVMNSIVDFIKNATCEITQQCAARSSNNRLRPITESDNPTIAIYPNPVKNNWISVTGIDNNTIFRILNMTGQELNKGKANNGRISVEGLNAGTYLLELQYKHQPIIKLFHKQ